MKKIITLVLVVAFMFSCMLVASATDSTPTLKLEIANVSDPTFKAGTTFELVVSYSDLKLSPESVSGGEVQTGEGDSLTGVSFLLNIPGYNVPSNETELIKNNGFSFAIDNLQSAISSAGTKNKVEKGYKYVQSITPDPFSAVLRTTTDAKVLTLKFKTAVDITEDIEFTIAKEQASTYLASVTFDEEGNKVGDDNVYSTDNGNLIIDDSKAKIVVSGGGEEPNIAEIVAETTVIEDNATTVGGEKTDAQIGAGVAFTVVNNSFKKMIWAITTADGTLYSQKSYPVDESGLIDGQLKVAATFINGTHDTGKAVTVEKVGAIFQDSEGADWYTDKAYADDKAE